MSSENPYQSPQAASHPPKVTSSEGRVYREQPTWRYWVLAAVASPGFLLMLFVVVFVATAAPQTVAAGAPPEPPMLLAGVACFIGAALYFALLGAIYVFWRTPSLTPHDAPTRRKTVFLFGSIVILSSVAMVSAFGCVVVGVTFASLAMGLDSVSGGVQLLIGLGAALVTGYVAWGLWEDARGKERNEGR